MVPNLAKGITDLPGIHSGDMSPQSEDDEDDEEEEDKD